MDVNFFLSIYLFKYRLRLWHLIVSQIPSSDTAAPLPRVWGVNSLLSSNTVAGGEDSYTSFKSFQLNDVLTSSVKNSSPKAASGISSKIPKFLGEIPPEATVKISPEEPRSPMKLMQRRLVSSNVGKMCSKFARAVTPSRGEKDLEAGGKIKLSSRLPTPELVLKRNVKKTGLKENDDDGNMTGQGSTEVRAEAQGIGEAASTDGQGGRLSGEAGPGVWKPREGRKRGEQRPRWRN